MKKYNKLFLKMNLRRKIFTPFTKGLIVGIYTTVRVGWTKKIDLKDDDKTRLLSVSYQKGIFYDKTTWWVDGLISPCWENNTRYIRPVQLTHNGHKMENTGFLVSIFKLIDEAIKSTKHKYYWV